MYPVFFTEQIAHGFARPTSVSLCFSLSGKSSSKTVVVLRACARCLSPADCFFISHQQQHGHPDALTPQPVTDTFPYTLPAVSTA